MTGVVFGKYQLIRRLAIGGMGEIFLARQTGLEAFDRLAIVKTLLPDLADQEASVGLFLDEARVAATLNHPNIVVIHEVGQWEGHYFIAMEYIHGDNLARLIQSVQKKSETIPLGLVARIIRDAARGLDHAHSATTPTGEPLHIVHRDVSPQNIMVRRDGVTKVVDFGIARAANRSTRTRTGVVKGKVRYMSPEQVTCAPELDARSDQFSLGVVFWELCTCRPLFVGDNDLQTMVKVTEQPIPSPSSLRPEIPPELETIVMRMLEREPGDRYPSCAAAAASLNEYLGTQSRSASQADLAALMERALGEALNQRTQDLTPSQESLLASFTPKATTPSSPTLVLPEKAGHASGETMQELPTARSSVALWASIALAMVLLVVLGGGGWWWTVQNRSAGGPIAAHATTDPNGSQAGAAGGRASGSEPLATATLSLSSTPTGATIRLNGQAIGRTPLDVDALAPGEEHTVALELAGHEPQTLSLRLTAGERRMLRVPLLRKLAAARRQDGGKGSKRVRNGARQSARMSGTSGTNNGDRGYLSLTTSPWTKVAIDGRPWGSTPLFKVELSSGKHEVHFVNEQAGIDERRSVEVKAGQTTKMRVDLE